MDKLSAPFTTVVYKLVMPAPKKRIGSTPSLYCVRYSTKRKYSHLYKFIALMHRSVVIVCKREAISL